MVKFARDCLFRMKKMVSKLETTLGPNTSDLAMRVGLHSGPVTAVRFLLPLLVVASLAP